MSETKILKLPGIPSVTGLETSAPPEIVAFLETMLDMAKAGQVRALALAYTIEDGSSMPQARTGYHYEDGRFRDLVWALAKLNARFTSEQIDE
jgi:hypothetical protein